MTHLPFGPDRRTPPGRLMMLLASLVVLGCSSAAPVPSQPTVAATSGTFNQKQVDDLLADNSLESLTALLLANSAGPPPKAMGCLHAWRSAEIADPRTAGIINRASQLESSGANYIVAPGTVRSTLPDRHSLNPQADVVYIFHPNGKYVGKIGGEFAADNLNGDQVLITDLGGKQVWFAVVTRFETSGEFEQFSRVFRLAESLPLLVAFRHQANDFDLPLFRGEQTISFEKPFIRFMGRGKTLQPPHLGTDSEGKPAVPELVWNQAEETFEGPASLTYRDQPVFQVDVQASPGFKEHSVRQWSASVLAVLEKVRASQQQKAE